MPPTNNRRRRPRMGRKRARLPPSVIRISVPIIQVFCLFHLAPGTTHSRRQGPTVWSQSGITNPKNDFASSRSMVLPSLPFHSATMGRNWRSPFAMCGTRARKRQNKPTDPAFSFGLWVMKSRSALHPFPSSWITDPHIQPKSTAGK